MGQALVPPLLALQFVAFGWRINREITLGDQNRRTWLLLADYLNLGSLLSVVSVCIVLPLPTGQLGVLSRAVLAFGYVLIAFYPVNIAAHYRLFSKLGRSVYLKKQGDDVPYLTRQEIISLGVAIAAAGTAASYVYFSG